MLPPVSACVKKTVTTVSARFVYQPRTEGRAGARRCYRTDGSRCIGQVLGRHSKAEGDPPKKSNRFERPIRRGMPPAKCPVVVRGGCGREAPRIRYQNRLLLRDLHLSRRAMDLLLEGRAFEGLRHHARGKFPVRLVGPTGLSTPSPRPCGVLGRPTSLPVGCFATLVDGAILL